MDLTAEEKAICEFLKSRSGQYVSAKDIAREASGKRREDDWALPVQSKLIEKNLAETDSRGNYRLKQAEEGKPKKAKRWVAPHIERILKQSGKKFEGVD